MKKYFKIIGRQGRSNLVGTLIILASTILVSGCTKNFEKYNTNPTLLTGAQSASLSSFDGLTRNIIADYQIGQNLTGDVFAGYNCPSYDYGGNSTVNYFMNDGWISASFNDPYLKIMGPIHKYASTGMKTDRPDLWAIALLVQVESMHQVTDKFGPVAYTKVGNIPSNPYDSQQSIYNTFFLQIDTAVTNLQADIASGSHSQRSSIAAYDRIYGGNYVQWLKFANSLRLRLAMRIVRADAATAQAQVLKALDPKYGGLLESAADAATIAMRGSENEIFQASQYNPPNASTNLNAAFVCYQNGYHDPRQPVAALAAVAPASAIGQYVGVRQGAQHNTALPYVTGGFSNYNYNPPTNPMSQPWGTDGAFTYYSPMFLMTASEVWFLRAEAALRGWSSETAQTDYNKGITTSMQEWGITDAAAISSYMNNTTATEQPYVDPLDPKNNVPVGDPTLSTITVKWDPAASQEKMLERIITQKWLAIFPNGQEAWSEFRRTGYPKLFTPVTNLSGGTISSTIGIRRLPYPATEIQTNGAAVRAAIATMLGGPDNGGTRLWWDPIEKGNF